MSHYVGNATYQCLHCRLAQRAEVRTIMLPRAHAANTALATLLALKHCPRCGHYDRNLERYHRNTVRVGLIGYALIAAVVALVLFAIPAVPRPAVAATGGVAAIGFVLLAWRLRRRYPVNVERRVQLVGSMAQNQRWF